MSASPSYQPSSPAFQYQPSSPAYNASPISPAYNASPLRAASPPPLSLAERSKRKNLDVKCPVCFDTPHESGESWIACKNCLNPVCIGCLTSGVWSSINMGDRSCPYPKCALCNEEDMLDLAQNEGFDTLQLFNACVDPATVRHQVRYSACPCGGQDASCACVITATYVLFLQALTERRVIKCPLEHTVEHSSITSSLYSLLRYFCLGQEDVALEAQLNAHLQSCKAFGCSFCEIENGLSMAESNAHHNAHSGLNRAQASIGRAIVALRALGATEDQAAPFEALHQVVRTVSTAPSIVSAVNQARGLLATLVAQPRARRGPEAPVNPRPRRRRRRREPSPEPEVDEDGDVIELDDGHDEEEE